MKLKRSVSENGGTKVRHIIDQSNLVILRSTQQDDLDFVYNTEHQPDNAQYVGQWTKEEHMNVLSQKDIMHLIVEDAKTQKPVGYAIIAGLENPSRSVELRRIVISEKGKGFGREALRLIKKLAFEGLKVHRLWLDVRYKNDRAQGLYMSEDFVREGVLRDCIFNNEEYESLIVMSIIKDEYDKRLIDQEVMKHV